MNKTVKREIREIFRRGYRIRADTDHSGEGNRSARLKEDTQKKIEVENFRLKPGTSSEAKES